MLDVSEDFIYDIGRWTGFRTLLRTQDAAKTVGMGIWTVEGMLHRTLGKTLDVEHFTRRWTLH